ncbi:MAG: hypothetical protein JSR26_00680 [Proteobacteria bacterium]|nr:hypothetical protein [Pseudomonadota bacterium]
MKITGATAAVVFAVGMCVSAASSATSTVILPGGVTVTCPNSCVITSDGNGGISISDSGGAQIIMHFPPPKGVQK